MDINTRECIERDMARLSDEDHSYMDMLKDLMKTFEPYLQNGSDSGSGSPMYVDLFHSGVGHIELHHDVHWVKHFLLHEEWRLGQYLQLSSMSEVKEYIEDIKRVFFAWAYSREYRYLMHLINSADPLMGSGDSDTEHNVDLEELFGPTDWEGEHIEFDHLKHDWEFRQTLVYFDLEEDFRKLENVYIYWKYGDIDGQVNDMIGRLKRLLDSSSVGSWDDAKTGFDIHKYLNANLDLDNVFETDSDDGSGSHTSSYFEDLFMHHHFDDMFHRSGTFDDLETLRKFYFIWEFGREYNIFFELLESFGKISHDDWGSDRWMGDIHDLFSGKNDHEDSYEVIFHDWRFEKGVHPFGLWDSFDGLRTAYIYWKYDEQIKITIATGELSTALFEGGEHSELSDMEKLEMLFSDDSFLRLIDDWEFRSAVWSSHHLHELARGLDKLIAIYFYYQLETLRHEFYELEEDFVALSLETDVDIGRLVHEHQLETWLIEEENWEAMDFLNRLRVWYWSQDHHDDDGDHDDGTTVCPIGTVSISLSHHRM